jgi:mono/diheme cytochrome c family protein
MRFFLGIVAGILLAFVGEALFLTLGGMPMSARRAKPLPFEEALAERALDVAIGKAASLSSPFPVDEANLLAGAKVYRENCMMCHGTAGDTSRTAVALGMFPRPPHLLPPDQGVTEDPVGETYWKARNGIRLSGMPGFEGSLTDRELWLVSLLLLEARRLPAAVEDQLR